MNERVVNLANLLADIFNLIKCILELFYLFLLYSLYLDSTKHSLGSYKISVRPLLNERNII